MIRYLISARVMAIALPALLLGQGGRGRGNAPQQPTNAQAAAAAQTGNTQTSAGSAAGRAGGRGGAAGAEAGGAAIEFFNFDANASQAFDASAGAPPVETHQKLSVNGQALAYSTRAGFLSLANATSGSVEARIFFTSYDKEGVSEAGARPLIFFVAGAPGTSAAWQELGGFGPKKLAAAGGWTDNPETLLNQADLVFVNPVGTGFSFAEQPSHAPGFWTSQGDVASLAAFVRLYLSRYGRSGSPLFLAGEDPATGRVAGMATYLLDHAITVRGIVLLSVAASADSIAGDTQYLTLLPSLTIASWYHKKLSAEMNSMSAEQIIGQARQFASREYLHALYKGDRMTAEDRSKVVADLARMTGLPRSVIVSNDLRISLDRFNSELMREQRKGLSRSDARIAGYTPTPTFGRGGGGGRGFGTPQPALDFNMTALAGTFAGAYDTYLRKELNYTANRQAVFYLTSGGVGSFTAGAVEDANLAAAFARNPNLRLFAAVNYFDLGLPFYAAEYTLAHLDVSPEVKAHNITISHQEAGQMAYLDSKALVKLEHDLGGFITRTAETK